MDTRSKKFKYSLFVKILCLILSVVFFAGAVACASDVLIGVTVVGYDNIINEKDVDYFETDAFKSYFNSDILSLVIWSQSNYNDIHKAIEKKLPEIQEEVYNNYSLRRGKIIRSELEYAVNNWDEDYFAFENSVNDGYAEFTTEFSSVDSDNTNSDEPKNIQVAKAALDKSTNPLDFNEYAYLVREEAFFTNYYFGKTFTIPYNDGNNYIELTVIVSINDLMDNPDDQKENINDQINISVGNYENDYIRDDVDYGFHFLKNLKYYIVSLDGSLTANIDEIPKNLQNYERYILAVGDNYKSQGFEATLVDRHFENKSFNEFCVYFENDFEESVTEFDSILSYLSSVDKSDNYSNSYRIYKSFEPENLGKYILEFVISLILSIFFFSLLITLCGHKNGVDGIKLSFIDKLPVDIHFYLSVGSIILFVVLILNMLFELPRDLMCMPEFKWIVIAFAVFVGFVLDELICSIVRIKKRGQSILKRTALFMLLDFLFSKSKKVLKTLKKELSYKPKHFKTRVILILVGYVILNLLIILFTVLLMYLFEAAFIVLGIWLWLLFNGVVGYYLVSYANKLDQIIVASSEHRDVVFYSADVPKSLRTLAENLASSNAQLDEAIEEAVKKEQMKTALITNVSHDLKTPLTSLINYTNLLENCEITDDKAIEYISVINSQSDKLKRLIEDLIEASKVSTGNVQLNKTKLNLYELAVQAVVEFTPDLEKNGNEIKLSEPENAPIVFADSTKTYRIISNLLSNAKKYSASGTRVYASVYEDTTHGYFEIKNISKEPLNISPDELTERFVRGDESRSMEGNGLGLSIAKDLCELQNGELILKIDGDLFKAIVKLPKHN